MAAPIKNQRDETPVYFATLAAHQTTDLKLREETKALDPQSFNRLVQEQK